MVQLVAQGKVNKFIAHDLGNRDRTVEGYVPSALSKLGFESRQDRDVAVSKGLFTPTPTRTRHGD